MRRVTLAVALIVAACSGGGDTGGLRVVDPWVRPTPAVASTAAFYLTVENAGDGDEQLVAAATDACRITEIHESAMVDGVMRMQHLPDGIEIPAATTVSLQPGGLHIMCIDTAAQFAVGDEIALTLEFLSADGTPHTETVTAIVSDR